MKNFIIALNPKFWSKKRGCSMYRRVFEYKNYYPQLSP